jgi:hypothetical protein
MKKQLLIAAVAATMASASMADISIAGSAKANFAVVDYEDTQVNKNTITREMDLFVTGKTGDTTVVMNFSNDSLSTGTGTGSTGGLVSEDSYVATKIGDVSVKAGAWDNGNNALRESGRTDGHLEASTTLGGVTVLYDGYGDTTDSSVKLSADISGVAVSFKHLATGEDIGVSTTVGGVKVSYLALNRDTANTDRSVIEVAGSFGGVDIKVAQAEADSSARIEGDSWMGDFENSAYTGLTSAAYDLANNQDVTSISLKTQMAGNTVEFINTKVDGVAGNDVEFNKFIVTRPLANGTTFEATYTDLDDKGQTTTDSSTLDLELAVKF